MVKYVMTRLALNGDICMFFPRKDLNLTFSMGKSSTISLVNFNTKKIC